MDKFEMAMEKMSEMSEEQLDTLTNMQKWKICICRDCPTFNECTGENKEGLFCFQGKSSCNFDIVDCQCQRCPAHSNFQMKYNSYCIGGSEKEQRAKE